MSTDMSKVKIWFLAIRPKTLPAAVGPVLVGTSFAIRDDLFNFFPAFAAVIGAILLQIAANLANDYFDFLEGYDTGDRIGPIRVAATGLLKINELRNGLIVNIVMSMIIGLYLIFVGKWPILIIGVLSIIFAVAYSGGPFPLTSNALGDIFVFIFFGLVAVNGTYYVQALSWAFDPFIGSVPVGLLITSILVVNNYRDIENDKQTGKTTLAVMFGRQNTRYYYVILLLISYLIPFSFLFSHYSVYVLLPLLSLPIAYRNIISIFQITDGPGLNKTLAGTAQLSLIYSLLFSVGIIL